MRFALIGRSEWLHASGRTLLAKGHSLGLVWTAKAAPEYTRTASDFEALAAQHGAVYLEGARIDEAPLDAAFAQAGPLDIGISVNFPGLLQASHLARFPHGILNAHGGDLPRYRGNACSAWALLRGEARIGLCVHRMVAGELDNGDLLARAYHPVQEDTRIGQIVDWMGRAIPELMAEAVTALEADPRWCLEVQSRNPADALRCYPRLPEDGRIDWRASALEIVRLVNASSEPYAGAFATLLGEPLVIWRARRLQDGERFCAVPGQVAARTPEGGLVVCTGDGKVILEEVTYRGTRTSRPGDLVPSLRTRLT